MTDEMILVPRAELLAWAKAWKNAYDPNDGTDCVTPFDWHLLKTPAEAQPADPVDADNEKAADRACLAMIAQGYYWNGEAWARAEAQPCGCGEATCTVPWEPGCGLGKSEQHAACVGCEGKPSSENTPCAVCGQQPASDGGFTAADMMDARQEGRKEAQQPVAVDEAMVERIAALLHEEATDEPWTVAGVEHDGPDRDYYRTLARKVIDRAGKQLASVDDLNAWRAAFIAERATRYRESGMAIEQARIHAETDVALMENSNV